jgi:hypothetical protein
VALGVVNLVGVALLGSLLADRQSAYILAAQVGRRLQLRDVVLRRGVSRMECCEGGPERASVQAVGGQVGVMLRAPLVLRRAWAG